MRNVPLCLLVIFFATQAVAQSNDESIVQSQTYGRNWQITWIGAEKFQPIDSTARWTFSPDNYLRTTGPTGSATFAADVILDRNAVFFSPAVTFYLADTSRYRSVTFWMTRTTVDYASGANPVTVILAESSPRPIGHMPGYTAEELWVGPDPDGHITIDIANNRTNFYTLWVTMPYPGAPTPLPDFSTLGLRGATVKTFPGGFFSPPPVPTFSDVPATHPFFSYIEQIYAAGITAGCAASPPRYCPDGHLTRGQAAVFLASGLGLHFPD